MDHRDIYYLLQAERVRCDGLEEQLRHLRRAVHRLALRVFALEHSDTTSTPVIEFEEPTIGV